MWGIKNSVVITIKFNRDEGEEDCPMVGSFTKTLGSVIRAEKGTTTMTVGNDLSEQRLMVEMR